MKNITQVPNLLAIDSSYLSHWIILDLDNTLFEPEEDVFLLGAREFLFSLPKDKVIIVTNSPRNLEKIKKLVPVPIYRGKKPFLGVWRKIQAKHGITGEEVVVIGDRLFTDGFFGKRIGCKVFLVSPKSKKEFFLIKLSRTLEHLLLR